MGCAHSTEADPHGHCPRQHDCADKYTVAAGRDAATLSIDHKHLDAARVYLGESDSGSHIDEPSPMRRKMTVTFILARASLLHDINDDPCQFVPPDESPKGQQLVRLCESVRAWLNAVEPPDEYCAALTRTPTRAAWQGDASVGGSDTGMDASLLSAHSAGSPRCQSLLGSVTSPVLVRAHGGMPGQVTSAF